MKQFNFTITDEVGMHARPAGLLVKLVKSLESNVTVEKNGNKAEATRLIALMGLGIKKGDTVTVEAEGADEDEAIRKLSAFFAENL